MSITGTKRKAKQLNVPAIEEDPAERKRLLNVLAQRRYRRRKKEHVQQLEHIVGKDGCRSSSSSHDSTDLTTPHTSLSFDEASFYANDQLFVDPTTNSGYFALPSEDTMQGFIDPICLDPTTLEAYNASFSFPLPSLPSSPSLSESTVTADKALSRTSRSQSAEARSPSFPDEVHLPMLELNLIRGAMAIAKRLQVDSLIWSLDSNSPFHNLASSTYSHLPVNLRPTTVQLRNAHHPIFDILPWPSVRDKLILVFSQPSDIRPTHARSPTALVDLVYDLEDSAEGVRIWGDDPYAHENWEIGEKVFSKWWWAFNSEVVAQSNELRRNRGARLLGVQRDVEEIE